jgi:DNA-binding transcriptional LysR family regulator
LLEYEVVIAGQPGLVPDPPSREDLEGLTWISREEGSATRRASDTAIARLGIVPRRRLELPSYEAVISALKGGYGVAAIGRYVVATELRAGLLTAVQVRGWDVRAAVSSLRVREALLSPSAEQFQVLVRKRLAELSHRDTKR